MIVSFNDVSSYTPNEVEIVLINHDFNEYLKSQPHLFEEERGTHYMAFRQGWIYALLTLRKV